MPSSVLRFAYRLFFWLGLATLVYAGGTAAFAEIYQRYHSQKFDAGRVNVIPHGVTGGAPASMVNFPALGEAPGFRQGDVVGRLEASRIGISVMVFEGVEDATLNVGAGRVPGTALPGAEGNIAIAGHRDTFFRKLRGIMKGDRIQLQTMRQNYEYVVDSTEIVDPEDTRVMESRARPELTLITCYPFHFVGAAPKRFIVHASLMTSALR